MKNFIEICKFNQKELKQYLSKYLISKKYAITNKDGFLLGIPINNEIPVLLVAHMDTVHKERIKEVNVVPYGSVDGGFEKRISSPQGIGGDDRCGIWAIMNLIDKYKCYVLFVEDEEIGGIGSTKFTKTEICKDIAKVIKYMIEIDRKGNNDAVFYSCDNTDFTEWITTNTTFKKATGTYSDISTLMPAMGIAGVNFSSGYYNAHTTSEYVVEEELNDIINRIGDLLTLEIPKQFIYVAQKYTRSAYSYYDDDYYWGNSYRNFWKNSSSASNDYFSKKEELSYPKTTTYKTSNKKRFDDVTEIRLTAYSTEMEMYYGTDRIEVIGSTKSECWLKLFMDYPEISFAMINEYYWE